jgi:hypothetical protein
MPFIEHNVMCHAVGLSPLCIADEDSKQTMVIELADVVQLLDKGEATEDT